MRRGFWLVTGAVLGVTGYRKANHIVRSLTGQASPSGALPTRPRQLSPIELRWRSPLALSMRSPARAAKPARRGDRMTSAAGFVRDVHAGMAEYWDLHRADIDRTLGSQGRATSARMAAGGSDPGHRAP